MIAIELAYVEKDHDEKIKSPERGFFDWETLVAISGIATFDLDSDLCKLPIAGIVTRVRMNAYQLGRILFRPAYICSSCCFSLSPKTSPLLLTLRPDVECLHLLEISKRQRNLLGKAVMCCQTDLLNHERVPHKS
jgi:hypothetical protein